LRERERDLGYLREDRFYIGKKERSATASIFLNFKSVVEVFKRGLRSGIGNLIYG